MYSGIKTTSKSELYPYMYVLRVNNWPVWLDILSDIQHFQNKKLYINWARMLHANSKVTSD